VKLVSANVDATHPLPVNGVIVLQFDRYLNPATITRQSFIVADASGQPLQGAIVSYDPIALTVSIGNPTSPATGSSPAAPWLTQGQSYKLFLPVSGSSTDISGLRAIDNAPLDPAVGPVEIAFIAGPKATQPSTPRMSFCGDILPVLAVKCGTGSPCHTPPEADGTSPPAASLVLTTPEGVAQTALGRISQASNTSGIAGQAVPPNRVFGLNFPIIDPGHASTSWLIYKIAMAPPPATGVKATLATCPDAAGKTHALQATTIKPSAYPPGDDEAAVLSDAILGRPMPYPTYAATPTYATSPLDFEERERIRLWIDQGAPIESCGACQ
jgi:hypothetical protein